MRWLPFVMVLVACPALDRHDCASEVRAPEVSAPVGETTEFTVTFTNAATRPLAVSGLELDADAPVHFRETPTSFEVPAGSCDHPGETGLVLRFAPTLVGRSASELRFVVDGEARSVALAGVGVGPTLSAPAVVNFGATGLRPSRPRRLELLNDGTLGSQLTARVESVVASPGTAADELCVGVMTADQCVPAEPVTITRSGALPLVVVPRGAGAKEWTVTVVAGTQRSAVRVLTEVVDTSGCELAASVERIEFGMVLAPQRDRRVVDFTNRGSGPCVVVDSTVSEPFELSGRAPTRLAAGAMFKLAAEVSLKRVASASGKLEVTLSPSTQAQRGSVVIGLTAATSAACLVLSPFVLDFGTAQAGCSGPQRQIALINHCATPLVITGLEVDNPFILGNHEALPHVLEPATSVILQLRLQSSSSIGSITSALRITLDPGSLLVGLSARVEPSQASSDHFGFEQRVLSDALLVLDDSPSFVRQHQRVRTELDALRRDATAHACAVDQRIGVTTTDVTAAGPRGRLRTTDAGVKWLTSTRPTSPRRSTS